MATLQIPKATESTSADVAEVTRRSDRIALLVSDPRTERFEGSVAAPSAEPSKYSVARTIVESAPLVRLTSSVEGLTRRIQVLQQFEGVVVELGKGEFTAEFRNLTEKGTPPEFAEFSYAEVSAPDRPLLEKGAVFYWVIGYDTSPTGQVTRVSEIRFRRAPVWGSRKLRDAADRAAERLKRIAGNASERQT